MESTQMKTEVKLTTTSNELQTTRPITTDETSVTSTSTTESITTTATPTTTVSTTSSVNTTTASLCDSFHSFRCKTNDADCVPMSLVCDGYTDCLDGSDEVGCPCGDDEYTCVSGDCIPMSLRCDGRFDCPDLSDELIWCHGIVKIPESTTISTSLNYTEEPTTKQNTTTNVRLTTSVTTTSSTSSAIIPERRNVSSTTMAVTIDSSHDTTYTSNKSATVNTTMSTIVSTTFIKPMKENRTPEIVVKQISTTTSSIISTSTPIFKPIISDCSHEPCKNGGQCKMDDGTGSWSCECKEGFTGKVCDEICDTPSTCSTGLLKPTYLTVIVLSLLSYNYITNIVI